MLMNEYNALIIPSPISLSSLPHLPILPPPSPYHLPILPPPSPYHLPILPPPSPYPPSTISLSSLPHLPILPPPFPYPPSPISLSSLPHLPILPPPSPSPLSPISLSSLPHLPILPPPSPYPPSPTLPSPPHSSSPLMMIRDIDNVHAGIGDRLVILIQWVATFFAGFLIGFIKDWRLTLMLLAVIPILLIAALIATRVRPDKELRMLGGGGRWGISVCVPLHHHQPQVVTSIAEREQKAYASAGTVASEVLSSIRTVVAFGAEEKEARRCTVVCVCICVLCVGVCVGVHVWLCVCHFIVCTIYRYEAQLDIGKRSEALKGVLGGLSLCAVFFANFMNYAVAFW